jgi:hypothetical protein
MAEPLARIRLAVPLCGDQKQHRPAGTTLATLLWSPHSRGRDTVTTTLNWARIKHQLGTTML